MANSRLRVSPKSGVGGRARSQCSFLPNSETQEILKGGRKEHCPISPPQRLKGETKTRDPLLDCEGGNFAVRFVYMVATVRAKESCQSISLFTTDLY